MPRRPSPGVAGALVPSARRHLWTNSRVPPGGSGAGGTIGSLIRAARKFGAALALPFVLLWKYKFAALSALKLTKLSSLASLALSTAAYAALYGVPYGVGIMAQIVIHESGHAIALMRYGVPFQPMVFVPLMGAYVSHAGMLSAWKNAFVALAGPFAGGRRRARSVPHGGRADGERGRGDGVVARTEARTNAERARPRRATGVRERGAEKTTAQLCHALADFGCMINLFNLLPMGMLDGGQVAAVLHPSLLVAGCAVGSYMAYDGQINNPIVYPHHSRRVVPSGIARDGVVAAKPRGGAPVSAGESDRVRRVRGSRRVARCADADESGEAARAAGGTSGEYDAGRERVLEGVRPHRGFASRHLS